MWITVPTAIMPCNCPYKTVSFMEVKIPSIFFSAISPILGHSLAGWLAGWTDGRTDGWMDEQTEGWMDAYMNAWKNEQTGGSLD